MIENCGQDKLGNWDDVRNFKRFPQLAYAATAYWWRGMGGCCAPLHGGAGSPSNTMWPGPSPTSANSLPSGILIHQTVWPQYTNVSRQTKLQTDRHRSDRIGRTVLQTVAQKQYNTRQHGVAQIWQKSLCEMAVWMPKSPGIWVVVIDELIEVVESASGVLDIGDAQWPVTTTVHKPCL